MVSVILLLLINSLVNGQDYKADFYKLQSMFKKHPYLSYTVKYKSYDTNLSKPDTIITAKFILNGNRVRTKLGSSEIIRNDKYHLAIDHDDKVMFVNFSRAVPIEIGALPRLDSLLTVTKSSVKYRKEGKIGIYTIPLTGEIYKHAEIFFEAETYTVQKVRFHLYAEDDPFDENRKLTPIDPVVEMEFSGFSTQQVPDANFSTDKYFMYDAVTKKLTVKREYEKYEIVNSMQFN